MKNPQPADAFRSLTPRDLELLREVVGQAAIDSANPQRGKRLDALSMRLNRSVEIRIKEIKL